jgi:hypothetical protein
MLHDARMAGLAKLRRSIRSTDERQLRAVLDLGCMLRARNTAISNAVG